MLVTLITGANGWLGTQLIDALVNGLPEIPLLSKPDTNRQVRCLVIPGSDTEKLKRLSSKIEIFEGDLRNINTLQEFCRDIKGATLFNCAGIIHPEKSIKELYSVNVEGTKNILTLAEKNGARRAIIMSSNSPIGISKEPSNIFNESSPYNPYMNYGRSKMQMEKIVHSFQERGKLETVIVRAPWFYGPGQPPRQSLFFKMVKQGKAPILGDGNNLRSMSYLGNLAQGLILCEKVHDANGKTYWISDEKPYTTNQIVDTIENLLENEFNISVTHKRFKLPYLVGEIATCMDYSIQSIGLYHQKIHVLSEMNKNIACSVEKAKDELGYKPIVCLEEGMRRSIDWCLKNGQNI